MKKSLSKLIYGVNPWNLSSLRTESTSSRSLLRMLSEAIIDDLLVKYPQHEQVLLQAKIDIDPKYHRWFAKTYDQYTKDGEDPDLYKELVELLQSFKKLTDQKKIKGSDSDIEKYKSPGDLFSVIEKASAIKSRTEKTKDEIDYLLRDDRFIVASPKTHDASCKLGSGTPWCISTPSNDSYWSDYTEQYEVHFVMVIDKTPVKPSYKKIAVAVSEQIGKYEIFDANDAPIDEQDLQEAWGDRFEQLWSMITGTKYNINKVPPKKETVETLNAVMAEDWSNRDSEFENIQLDREFLSQLEPNTDRYDQPARITILKSVLNQCTVDDSAKVTIYDSNLNKCEIKNIKNYQVAIYRTKINNSLIESCDLGMFHASKIFQCNVRSCISSDSLLIQLPIFFASTLTQCNLGHINVSENQVIENTDFNNCTFSSVWFSNGKFKSCNFTGCRFDDAIFAGTIFDSCTFINTVVNVDLDLEELQSNADGWFINTNIPGVYEGP